MNAMRLSLEEAGLRRPQVDALLETFRDDFFETDGVRVITILPRVLYDRALPVEILPPPTKLVRVGLIWKECALPR
jgi:hypothetical protein